MAELTWLERLMNTVADRGRDLLGLRDGEGQADLPGLCRRLVSGRGEASNIALAREVLQRFEALDGDRQTAFFSALDAELAPDPEQIRQAAAALRRDLPETLERLLAVVEPPRQELFRRLNMAPQGTASLVAMRARLLRLLPDHPRLASVEHDLRHLLASWFNRGFLRLERIDWHSPAAMLERLMHSESVHPLKGWDDLRRRLAADRRCFGFFHPALPEQPLIFVEVALTRDAAAEITSLLDPQAPLLDPYAADTAVFFSINNALSGLSGISFGNFLLKQVLSELAAELPRLTQFVTLSPIPRMVEGLGLLLDGRVADWPVARLDELLADQQAELKLRSGQDSALQAVRQLLAAPEVAGHPPPETMHRLALLYLTQMQRANGGRFDPVAAFHLANGAILDRINVCADLSEKGLAQSHGVMVNYRYEPAQVEAHHEAFVREGRIAMSRRLQREHDKYLARRH